MTLVTASDRPRRTRVRSRAGRIVRSVKIYAIAGGTVALSLVAAPAFAAPYPVPDAKNELVAAIAATNAAPSYQYLDNNLGWTALIESIVLGDGGARHLATLQALVGAGADVNLADRSGRTPLHLAEANGYREMAQVLRAAGAR